MTKRLGSSLAGFIFVTASASAWAATVAQPPPTPREDYVDTYYGIRVADPYHWLENGSDPKVHAWGMAQDKRTRDFLDGLPLRAKIHARVMDLVSQTSPAYSGLVTAGGKIFANYSQPPKQQVMLAVLPPSGDPEQARVVVDPNALNPAGTTAIDWFVPSPDGSKVAVSLSENGSEDGVLHIFDVASGHDLGLQIPRVQYPTGGGALAWREDGSGFWYTRYLGPEAPADQQHFYQRLYYHHLGDDVTKDVLVVGKDFPKVAEIALDNSQDHQDLLVAVANGDGGEFAHYVIGRDGAVHQVTHFSDHVVAASMGPDGTLYLVSRDQAPRGKILTLAPGDFDLSHAKELIAQSDGVIEGGGEFGGSAVTVTDHALYLREIVGGPSRVVAYSRAGKKLKELPLPKVAAVSELISPAPGKLLYSVATYLQPPYYEAFDEKSGRGEVSKLVETSPIKFDDAKVTRVLAVSADGTKVPVNIIAKKTAKPDSENPTLLYGYGGYNVSLVPAFLGERGRLWLDGGGVLAIANLRGGGEFGETWHDQGALTHKQNVFDDFYAAAQYLISSHWTNAAKLAAQGGSNGGLLMGAMITQHPDEFEAIVSSVGIYDMLRVEKDPNGAFNTTEYGTVQNRAQFDALYAYSPYHHVRPGTAYPAIFMATGEHDGRVNPMHSRKMVAALQAASSAGTPILLSMNAHAGHGMGSSLSIKVDQMSDYLTFLFTALGMNLND